MLRFAAHFVWYKQVYKMHYIELQDDGTFLGVFPLNEEIESTSFYDGILIPLLTETKPEQAILFETWKDLTAKISEGSSVSIYRLTGLDATAAKLGTDDGRGNCHIERL
ncbi:hypothetical protein LJC57_09455 [Parabacteroides sp. OttesenSCG-928-G07]|nr:hypothetical protein [Parabacteroides sp. OttesenSCG-928-G21]MDL2278804.1 hypothetical protein [Parabacteroides sp. OttesenSCG-928-G07]